MAASFSKAGEEYMSLIEHVVHNTEHDAALKTMLRNRRGPEETFATAPLSQLVTDLDESRAEAATQPALGEDKVDGDDAGVGGGAPADTEFSELPAEVQEEVTKASAE